ncbi:30S ribosomal protein S12 methylthiotransferase RimO [Desulfurispora thermophila]|uniref:30S ribosomal protein S12 methylthiotransferase RimO n=1 Tax=Desulfurispora thermophila TaxID=265470 RepID=UPI00036C8B6B|nr:30S ribosomal protein S12 methylthiotransferase RimO [Desulfurispora thermophila]
MTAGIISLGCPKNQVDSEVMLGLLKAAGYDIVPPDRARVLIINTCGFITPAKEEAIEVIMDAVRRKMQGQIELLVVAGCLAQRYPQQLYDEIPEIDLLLGTGEIPRLPLWLSRVRQGERVLAVGSPHYDYSQQLPRLLPVPGITAYLKIAEGCSNRCAYCAIPLIRGPLRSRPRDLLLREAEQLLAGGVKELVVVAQDTTAYGRDLYGRPMLPHLLDQLAGLGFPWVRLMYCYPEGITPQLVEVLARRPNICRYLDIPLQHASPGLLRAMRRRGDIDEVRQLIAGLRRALPGLVLRTTFMVGFPGESEADFECLLAFMQEIKFERAGFFKYVAEEGTAAAVLPGQVPEQVKEERYQQCMTLQQQISHQYNQQLVGRDLEVLLEERLARRRGIYRGRTRSDAPEIDGRVYVRAAGKPLRVGDLVTVRIRSTTEYDLKGDLLS